LTQLLVKRVYDEPSAEDGIRILVDRLWPRGLSKEHAKIDLWAKELAPSHQLRRWMKHESGEWPEFIKRYTSELDALRDDVVQLKNAIGNRTATLLYASRDRRYNNAVLLKEYLERV